MSPSGRQYASLMSAPLGLLFIGFNGYKHDYPSGAKHLITNELCVNL